MLKFIGIFLILVPLFFFLDPAYLLPVFLGLFLLARSFIQKKQDARERPEDYKKELGLENKLPLQLEDLNQEGIDQVLDYYIELVEEEAYLGLKKGDHNSQEELRKIYQATPMFTRGYQLEAEPGGQGLVLVHDQAGPLARLRGPDQEKILDILGSSPAYFIDGYIWGGSFIEINPQDLPVNIGRDDYWLEIYISW